MVQMTGPLETTSCASSPIQHVLIGLNLIYLALDPAAATKGFEKGGERLFRYWAGHSVTPPNGNGRFWQWTCRSSTNLACIPFFPLQMSRLGNPWTNTKNLDAIPPNPATLALLVIDRSCLFRACAAELVVDAA